MSLQPVALLKGLYVGQCCHPSPPLPEPFVHWHRQRNPLLTICTRDWDCPSARAACLPARSGGRPFRGRGTVRMFQIERVPAALMVFRPPGAAGCHLLARRHPYPLPEQPFHDRLLPSLSHGVERGLGRLEGARSGLPIRKSLSL
jgi:hypothetical protein